MRAQGVWRSAGGKLSRALAPRCVQPDRLSREEVSALLSGALSQGGNRRRDRHRQCFHGSCTGVARRGPATGGPRERIRNFSTLC